MAGNIVIGSMSREQVEESLERWWCPKIHRLLCQSGKRKRGRPKGRSMDVDQKDTSADTDWHWELKHKTQFYQIKAQANKAANFLQRVRFRFWAAHKTPCSEPWEISRLRLTRRWQTAELNEMGSRCESARQDRGVKTNWDKWPNVAGNTQENKRTDQNTDPNTGTRKTLKIKHDNQRR